MVITPTSFLSQLLADLLADADVAGCIVRLYQNNLQPTQQNVFADFSEANFVGYAAVAGALVAPTIDPQGNPQLVGSNCRFTAGAVAGPQTIYGYYVTNAANNKLLWSEAFATPIVINGPGQMIGVVPVYAATVAQQLPI